MDAKYFVLDWADRAKIGYIQGKGYWEPKRRDDWSECIQVGDVVGDEIFYGASRAKARIDWAAMTVVRDDGPSPYPLSKE